MYVEGGKYAASRRPVHHQLVLREDCGLVDCLTAAAKYTFTLKLVEEKAH